MRDAGASVHESRPAGIEESFDIGTRIWTADGGAAARRLLEEAGTTEFSIETSGEAVNAEGFDKLWADWYDLRSRMTGYFNDHDVIICPVNAKPAIPHGATELPDYSYTISYNVTGWPAGVVRAGTSPEGLPIGIQIVAAPVREDVVLAVAAYLEQAFGGFQRPMLEG